MRRRVVRSAVCLGFLLTGLCWTQTTRSTTVFDPSGNRLPSPTTEVRGNSRIETLQSINGRMVPMEQSEERVVAETGTEKVVERTVRRYDPSGAVAGMERIEERRIKNADGSTTVRATRFSRDLNGNMVPAERTTSEIHKTETSQTVETVVERRGVDGSFQTAEKQSTVESQTANRTDTVTVTLRRDSNGHFYEALRENSERVQQGNAWTANTARYERGELFEQRVEQGSVTPGGGESQTVTVYSRDVAGKAGSSGSGGLALKEQQTTERRKIAGGEVVERQSVRQPSPSDPDRLGPSRVLRETVCRGECR